MNRLAARRHWSWCLAFNTKSDTLSETGDDVGPRLPSEGKPFAISQPKLVGYCGARDFLPGVDDQGATIMAMLERTHPRRDVEGHGGGECPQRR